MHQRARAQPADELAPIRRGQYVVERVVLARALEALVLRHEMQVVIAEHRNSAIAQIAHEAQHFE